MHMAMRARTLSCSLLALLLLGSATAQDKPTIDVAKLKERISRLPATAVDLRKASVGGDVRPAPKPAPTVESKSAAGQGTNAAKQATTKGVTSAPQIGGALGGLVGKPAPKPTRPPKPTAAAANSGAAANAHERTVKGVARYVPLPPEMANEVHQLIAEKVKTQLPSSAGHVLELFHGAVMLQAEDSTEVTLVPVVLVDDPLRFMRESRLFEGRIAVGLVELDRRGPAKKLSGSVGFQVFGEGRADPEIAEVGSTSPPFAPIRIAAPDPNEAVELRVVSNVSAEPVKVSLPVQRAELSLSAKRNLQGWGLESTEVTVSADNGEASEGEVVLLSAPLGNLSAQKVTLGRDGTAQATLRSESTGRVRLSASSARLKPASVEFSFAFPTRFLISGLIGGLAGGLLRRGMRSWRNPRRLLLGLLLSVITGALVFGLFVLGVNVVGVPLPRDGGEVLVAVVAALGAFFGTAVLKAPATSSTDARSKVPAAH
jgi:hypothetical protein